MSIENHPNFNAAKFTADITKSYLECLRGGASIKDHPSVSFDIASFVYDIDLKVDDFVAGKTKT